MASAAVKKLMESERYQEIRQDLMDQLERSGMTETYYTDLVDDYMALWIDKQLLTQNIQTKGVVVKYNNGGGQKGQKRNDAITDKLKVSSQMLSILNALGIRPPDADGDEDDDDEL